MSNEVAFAAWHTDKGDETLLLKRSLKSDDTIVDVGGYLGNWSSSILLCSWPITPRVFIFEPVDEFCIRLRSRFAGVSQVTVINAALSNRTDTAKITKAGDGSHISMDGEEIKTLDVVDFFQQYNIDRIDLMSINIEGHEYALLRRIISTGLVERVKRLQIQFHDSYPNADNLRNDIREKLTLTHEELYCYPFVWECWRAK
jgi:FkbM family methyltransferase